MADASLLGFTGAFVDPVTAAYPLGNGYRWFLPALMRFNAPDSLSPFGAGGINPYAYCADDPVNRSDPSGHVSINPVIAAFVEDSVHRAYRGEAPYEPITAPQPTPRRKPPPADGETVDSDSDSYPSLKTPRKRLRSDSYSPPRSPTRIPSPASLFPSDHEQEAMKLLVQAPEIATNEFPGQEVPPQNNAPETPLTVDAVIQMAYERIRSRLSTTTKVPPADILAQIVVIMEENRTTVAQLKGFDQATFFKDIGYESQHTYLGRVRSARKGGTPREHYERTFNALGIPIPEPYPDTY